MDVADVRRLSASILAVAFAVILWLVFLALDDADLFNWGWPSRALGALQLQTWLWIGAGTLAALVGLGAMTVFGIGAQEEHLPSRQVQCQHCKAVFFMPDNGRRPLMHPCPNCKALGVYDGLAPAVGKPPEVIPESKIVKVNLTCRNCQNRFPVTDTGVRPLRIECPKCKAVGALR